MYRQTYSGKIRVQNNSAIAGQSDKILSVDDHSASSDSMLWDVPLIKAFLEDDDIQEMTICSTNIGFVKTFTKLLAMKKRT